MAPRKKKIATIPTPASREAPMAYLEMTVENDEWELPGGVISTEGKIELTVSFETEGGEPVVFEYLCARAVGKDRNVDFWLDAALRRWVSENQAKLTQRYFDSLVYRDAAE